ncbi:hypothetical protein MPDQ_000350 [Monascus purpureus]|uniref:Uncharacterized protein n=1 Tax=Monascus purpureus TaxID=5098 RepID=A0A507QQ11_MONPU|nr:hypothetical protein MPDQ_000350 [Monascus purpureus]
MRGQSMRCDSFSEYSNTPAGDYIHRLTQIHTTDTPSEVGKRAAFFGASDMVGNMFLSVLQAALYKNLDGVNGLAGWQWLFIRLYRHLLGPPRPPNHSILAKYYTRFLAIENRSRSCH